MGSPDEPADDGRTERISDEAFDQALGEDAGADDDTDEDTGPPLRDVAGIDDEDALGAG